MSADEHAVPEDQAVPDEQESRHGAPVTRQLGQVVLHPARARYRDLVDELRREGYTVCVDVTATDYLTHAGRSGLPVAVTPERFELVTILLSFERKERLRIRVQVPDADPVVASLFDLHPGTEAMEREVYDMFGIVFDGHPDLTRILMPEDWEGHPLRKDYAVGRIPVQFKGAPGDR